MLLIVHLHSFSAFLFSQQKAKIVILKDFDFKQSTADLCNKYDQLMWPAHCWSDVLASSQSAGNTQNKQQCRT